MQPNWLDYNHLYEFGRSLHQQEYQILKKGYGNGLSKKQVANVFLNQSVLIKARLSPLNVIDEYHGILNGSVKGNFYRDCAFIPDPSESNVEGKNLLILDDCFLGKQNKDLAYRK